MTTTAPAPPTTTAPPRPAVRAPRPTREIRAGEPAEIASSVISAVTVVAAVCVWVLLQTLVLGAASENRSQDLLYQRYRVELAGGTAPTGFLDYRGHPVQPGDPVAIISVPALHLSQVVVSGTSSGDLLDGPGHLRTTPLPGQAGASVVMGRATTYGAPFGQLHTLRVGDRIEVQNAQGRVTYTVQDLRRAGDPMPVLEPGQSRLTLITSDGTGPLSRLRSGAALNVDAVTTKALPAGAAATGVLPQAEHPMQGDTSALPLLVLVLAALALLVLATAVAARHVRGVLVWLLATPAVLALAWVATDQAVRLLPNLM